MLNRCKKFRSMILLVALGTASLFSMVSPAWASPFGAGVFGANVPYGGQTSLTIATDGDVEVPITPSDSGTLASSNSVVTVTSSDVVGYKLYIRALSSTNMVNGSSNIPASANGSPASLATNTWGYNTDGSSNYVGVTLSDVLIRTGTGPYTSGDQTTVKYGVKVDNTIPAGDYSTTIVYTAVPQTQ